MTTGPPPDSNPLISFIAAVAHADGHVSDEEFNRLYHLACRHATPDEAGRRLKEFARLSPEAAQEATDAVLAETARTAYTDRLEFLLRAFDFAALDGVGEAEDAVLRHAARVLRVEPADFDAIRWAITPESSEPPEAEALVQVVHVGRGVPGGIPISVAATFSVIAVGTRRFLRVIESDDVVLLDQEPALLVTLIELAADARLVVPPYTFGEPDVAELLAARAAAWSPAPRPPAGVRPEMLPILKFWRRGPLVGVQPTEDGLLVNGARVPPGEIRAVLRGDRLTARGVTVRLKAGGGDAAVTSSIDISALGLIDDDQGERMMTSVLRQARGVGLTEHIDGLHIRHVTMHIGDQVLVDDVSFDVEQGELVAIIGPSGCGKTTLLEALCGATVPSQGEVLARMGLRAVPLDSVASHVALVPQDEILLPQLTVFENIDLACRLRLPLLPEEDRRRLVDQAVSDVGLGSRRDMRVGSPERRLLSGGQRRRVGMALELTGKPDVLLLDEPLSGLSSQDARNMMVLFRDLARRGRVVVVVVHQPSRQLFDYFDKVLVMDRGGKVAYFGPPKSAIEYFAEHSHSGGRQAGRSPGEDAQYPDIILSTMEQRRERRGEDGERERLYPPDYWQALFTLRNPEAPWKPPKTPDVPDGRRSLESRARQFGTVLARHALVRIRNRSALALSFFVAPFLGLLLGWVLRFAKDDQPYLFGQNENLIHFLFLVPVVTFFLGMTGSCTEFIVERRLLRHERLVGIPSRYYLASKLIVLLLWGAVESALFAAISAWVLWMPGPYGWFYVLAFATNAVGICFGLMVSAFADNIRVAFGFVPLALIPQLLFGGLIPYEKMNRGIYAGQSNRADAPFVGQLMPARWSYEGLAVTFATRNPFAVGGGHELLSDLRDEERGLAERKRAGELDADGFYDAKDRVFEKRKAVLAERDHLENVEIASKVSAARAEALPEGKPQRNAFLAPERSLVGVRLFGGTAALLILILQCFLLIGLAAFALWRAAR